MTAPARTIPATAEPFAQHEPSPIDRYLAEQADLTAVRRFARLHDAGHLPHDGRLYRDLIPLASPGPGEQYGFEVDLDACTGCQACVTACSSLNGLDANESWRSVGVLHGTAGGLAVKQTVTTACHHCVDPACLNGCPVDAYEKDPHTGIVKHLDDQCIGCGYCTLTCPYEVPVYNEDRGIVRKCDMCSDRLSVGEAPACAQACPNHAIRITIVETSAAIARAADATLVADAPPSAITVPTTVYRAARPDGDLVAADRFSLRPAHSHPPLAVMLVLTQLAVGTFVTDLVMRITGHRTLGAFNAFAALGVGVLALAASTLHLGRPRYAYRAILGLRHSWLSREILAFGLFAMFATVYAGVAGVAPATPEPVMLALGVLVAVAGVGGVVCSVMVYVATRRVWWRLRYSGAKFALTTAVCGLATVQFTSLTSGAGTTTISELVAVCLIVAGVVKLASEAAMFRHLLSRNPTELKRTALLLTGDLAVSTLWRFSFGFIGLMVTPTIIVFASTPRSPVPALSTVAAGVGLVAVTVGELIERSQFFRAVVSTRMPGTLT